MPQGASAHHFLVRGLIALRTSDIRAQAEEERFAAAASFAIATGWAPPPQSRGPLDRRRRPLVLLHRACRGRRARRPRRRRLGPLHRALPRRSGAPQPRPARRRPDRESGRGNRVRHRIRRLGRPEDKHRPIAAGAGRLVRRLRLARVHDQFRVPHGHRRDSGGDRRGGLLPVDCAGQAALRARELSYRQSRDWRPSGQLVACLGHRAGDRRRGCRGVRISRRLLHQRGFQRDRPRRGRPRARQGRLRATQVP